MCHRGSLQEAGKERVIGELYSASLSPAAFVKHTFLALLRGSLIQCVWEGPGIVLL